MILQTSGTGIDRIKCTGFSVNKEVFDAALNLFGFQGCSGGDSGGCFWVGCSRPFKGNYTLKMSYFQTKKDLHIFSVRLLRGTTQTARFELCRTPRNTCHAGYEIHPTHLTRGELKPFDDYIIKVMGPNYGYRSFFEHGKVNSVEWFTDLLNIPPDSFLIHSSGARKSAMYQGPDAFTIDPATVDYSDPDDADLIELIEQHNITKPTTIPRAQGYRNTQYSGSRQNNQFKSYCSKTRLIDTNRPDPYSHHPYRTRLEVTLRKTGLVPCNLASLANPFLKKLILDLSKAAAIKDRKFTWFIKSAQIKGIAAAIQGQKTDPRRKRMRALLSTCQADWFNPNSIWSGRDKALEGIEPDWLLTTPQPKMFAPVVPEPLATMEDVQASLALFAKLAQGETVTT